MRNYEIKQTIDGRVMTLNNTVQAASQEEAIFKAFDLARIFGNTLPTDGNWTAEEVIGDA